ncbi:MAG: iron-sulfur cluster assembly scaffold protein [Candidatus Veblenbacteria bacterium]|nr:iron-sulfur cluster assembly scaffold protein [Candidatus Veblenbacteria bacterium]
MDLYQQNIMDYYKHPRKQGLPTGATHRGDMANPLCGDKIDLHLVMSGGTVTKAGWEGEGCVLSLAAADMLAEYLQGKSETEAGAVDQSWVKKSLGVSPSPSRLKCALLALEALQKALAKN